MESNSRLQCLTAYCFCQFDCAVRINTLCKLLLFAFKRMLLRLSLLLLTYIPISNNFSFDKCCTQHGLEDIWPLPWSRRDLVLALSLALKWPGLGFSVVWLWLLTCSPEIRLWSTQSSAIPLWSGKIY